MKKKFLKIIFTIVFIFFLFPISALAVDLKPILQITIPNIDFSDPYACGLDNKLLCVPWIAEYIVGVYKYGVGIGGILAAIVLMWGGVIWLSAGGNQQRVGEAQNWIKGSITGLVLLLSSYVLLYQINPDLLNLKPIQVSNIEAIEKPELLSSTASECGGPPCTKTEVDPADLKLIGSSGDLRCQNAHSCKIKSATYAQLNKVAAEAEKQGYYLLVVSAGRSVIKQKSVFEDTRGKRGKEVCKYASWPDNCAPHVQHIAVDACLCKKTETINTCRDTGSCNGITDGDSRRSDAVITKLQALMKRFDFVRFCNEWWHFEYPPDPSLPQRCSP